MIVSTVNGVPVTSVDQAFEIVQSAVGEVKIVAHARKHHLAPHRPTVDDFDV